MINTMKIRLILSFVLLIYSLVCQADGGKDSYIFRKVDYQQGLSNSAVLCLFQDNTGLMWFGTYDGVNCYDGRNMEVFRSDFSAPKALSNNVIHSIQQADNNCLWISTHLGINRLSQDSRQVVGYYDFTDDYYLHSNSKGNTWVVSHGGIFYYNTSYKRFVQIKNLKVPVEDMDKRAFGVTIKEKLPSISVMVPSVESTTFTFAPITPSPVGSVILPFKTNAFSCSFCGVTAWNIITRGPFTS